LAADFALASAMLVAGLASGVHCVAMCGGIVTAFDARRVIPIRAAGASWGGTGRRWAFNAGRISTYAAAGAAAGALGASAYAAAALPPQEVLEFAMSLLLVAIGTHLAFPALLARVERLGLPLWRRVQPLASRLLGAPTLPHAFAGGLAWGFLPCAMVYAALASATAAGSALQGALAMAAFGAGTLPFLLAAGWLAARIASSRRLAGGLLLGFGFFGLAHAAGAADAVRRGLLCF
jgi:sulfite exporter TauE/SafE